VHVLKQYLASAPGQNQPVVVDVPAAPAGLPSSALPAVAPQIEDLTALRKQFQRREISPEDYRNRLAAAEQILRSPAAHLRH
jgi:hypothetical protein